ncbi:hypothetical protein FNF28_00775 [Cafeteria roenbergensis]|uniref:Uncharacterized protein n=1 Tax=Cafeteria roenbergensis TaxID=33653 RepID=A0A5A8E2T9_CAFRO|nr:hypothetical protein FNF28_00775 [Cafeteria roenbergensis]
MCTPSAFGGRIVCIPSTPLFLAQLLVALGAASYFFLAGFLYNEFYEEVGQSPVAGLQLRTDTLDYAATVLGVNDTSACVGQTLQIPAFGSRFATAGPGAAPLNFTPSCSGLEAALTAAAAVGPSSDARLPTSVVRYEWLRVPAAGAADVAAMESLGFRVVPYAGGATGVRASGTVYRTDARLVTLEETLTVLADGQGSVGTSGEVEPYVGRESRFGFRLVTSSGAVVRRCLRAGALATNLSLTASELESQVFTACEAAAGVPARERPVLTLDALLFSAGVGAGLSTVDASLEASLVRLSQSNGVAVPLQVAGVSLDVEMTYDNLPVLERSPDPSAVAVTARAVVATDRDASWVGSSIGSRPSWEAVPGAAHLVVRPTAAAACQSLSWSSTSADVAACLAASPGGASEAFDVSSVAATVRSRDETFGAVVRAVPSGRLVRFSYMELASLGVQSLVKYLLVWGAVLLLGVQCCPERVRSAVCLTVRADGDKEDDGGDAESRDVTADPQGAGRSSMQRRSSVDRQSLTAMSATGFGRFVSPPRRGRDLDARMSATSSKEVSKGIDELRSSMAALSGNFEVFKKDVELKVSAIFALVEDAGSSVQEMHNRVSRVREQIHDEIRSLYARGIEAKAASAARDAVRLALTGVPAGSGARV